MEIIVDFSKKILFVKPLVLEDIVEDFIVGLSPKDYDFEFHKKLVSMQKGDVPITYSDTSDLERDFCYKPSTSLKEGLRRFSARYYSYYIK